MQVPKYAASVESGLSSASVWVVDEYNDIFYFDGISWDIIPGKKSITISAGGAGIFSIDPFTKQISIRQNASPQNPKGDSWKVISENRNAKIKFMESTYSDIIYGVSKDNELFFARKQDLNLLDDKWQRVQINVNGRDNINNIVDKISCNHYSCWILTTLGSVYSTSEPRNPLTAIWYLDDGECKKISLLTFT